MTVLHTIIDQKVKVVKFVSTNDVGYLCSITDYGYLIIERYKSNLPVSGTISDVYDLLADCSLDALHPAHVCNSSLTLKELVRAIAKFLEIL